MIKGVKSEFISTYAALATFPFGVFYSSSISIINGETNTTDEHSSDDVGGLSTCLLKYLITNGRTSKRFVISSLKRNKTVYSN